MNTEIEIPVTELKSALPGLAKIVPRSSSLPVLQCIKVSLDAGKETVSLQAHNLDEIVTIRTPNQTDGPSGELLIPFELLTKLIKGCAPDQSVRFITNGEETQIRYNVAGSSIDRLVSHFSATDWPAVKELNQEPILLANTFKLALKEALECASADSSRHVLNGACLDVNPKDAHYVVGSNGCHLYAANSFHFSLSQPLIVPSRKFLSWPGFIGDGPWSLRMLPAIKNEQRDAGKNSECEEPPWFRIDSERWSYIARGIDGPYPNWRQVVPETTNGWTRITLQPVAISTILDALPLLPGGEEAGKPITLAAGNDLVLKARGADQSEWTRVNVPEVSITGKPVQITLNRCYLLKALRFGFQHLEIRTSLEPILFTCQGKSLVVMPLRCPIDEPVEPGVKPAVSVPESAPDARPSAPEASTPTDERKNMSATTITTPEPENLQSHGSGRQESEEPRSAFRAAIEQVEGIKSSLRDVVTELSEAVTMLKAAEREQRASAKEIDAIRSKLREIQSVEI